jgi:hypothetical protein
MPSALRRMPFDPLMWSMAAFRRIPDAQARVTKCRQRPIRSQSVFARERRLSGVDRALCVATSLTRQRRLAANSQAANGSRFSPMSGFLPLWGGKWLGSASILSGKSTEEPIGTVFSEDSA